jgi:Phage integrase, N-terminal SAM-like domain
MGSQPGLLAVAREKMRIRHLALRTEQAYLQWLRRYVVFHNRRHPRELGAPEVEQFLTYLAVHRKVSAATQITDQVSRVPRKRLCRARAAFTPTVI